ncbi:hypothetical protein SGQ44_05735 [Flavobacterium sp. Fl-77]|uniref:Uncharacterized protein n=1 Tax=Flavobacterium flavipigmentatum TaxID=2893884 RepID=A0AAJ2VVX3_9FLAO|nr:MULTISPECIES: hypothetical protein [unclassified Flavobacterium]MDX6181719.1 hypothetical protein [Flavobacterium sp. Fl-33]MDX6185247.1 hypothetical protein [Flavobacterium sp. Fl-77]UFH37353.1 hypothetical protein LNP22_11465 [Flavobacterium sp. F-70]
MKTQHLETIKNDKGLMLVLGLLFDAIGMMSFTIPGIGEFADIIWAPIAALLMSKMYKGRVGKVASVLTFLEEIIPFTDIIPSFTLTWIYTYYFQKQK